MLAVKVVHSRGKTKVIMMKMPLAKLQHDSLEYMRGFLTDETTMLDSKVEKKKERKKVVKPD